MKKIFVQIALLGSTLIGQYLHAQGYNGSCQNFGSQYQCGNGIFEIGGDWLYWKTYEEGLALGALAQPSGTPASTITNLPVIKPKFKDKSGYRAFVNYHTNNHKWKIEACFSHIPSSANITVLNDPGGEDFISIFATNFPLLAPVATINFTNASSRLNQDINYFDLDLCRSFSVCRGFEVSPHIGMRGFWLNQKYNIHLEAIPSALLVDSELKGKIAGVGIEGGLAGEYKLGLGFSICGHLGGSLIFSKFTNEGIAQIVALNETRTLAYTDKNKKGMPTIDSFIGIHYTNEIGENYPISFLAGWEHHFLFSTNQFSQVNGNLSLQGLTLGASIGF